MISLVDNGRCYNWMPTDSIEYKNNRNNGKILESVEEFDEEINPKHLKSRSSFWKQFCVLYKRRTIQMWRDSVSKLTCLFARIGIKVLPFHFVIRKFQSYMKLRIYMTLFLGLVVGGIYQGIGNDASKALFNFGFCFTVTIAFMYNPLMPVLLQCKNTISKV